MSLKTDAPAAAPPAELLVTLRKPVVLGPLTISDFRLREPLAGEYREIMRSTGFSSTLTAVSMIGGVPMGAVNQIGVRDLNIARDYLDHFFDAGADPADRGLEELDMPLRKSIDVDGVTHCTLHLREPTGGELVEVTQKSGVASTITAVALVTGLPVSAIEQIAVRDLNRAGDFLMVFINGGRQAGGRS